MLTKFLGLNLRLGKLLNENMSDTFVNPSGLDYVEPNARTFSIRTNVVPGYVTARVAPRLIFGSGYTYAFAPCVAIVRNDSGMGSSDYLSSGTSAAAVTVRFQETDGDPTINSGHGGVFDVSGARTNLGNAVTVVPGGQTSISFTPHRKFVEFKGLAGKAKVTIEIQTTMNWDEEGFSQDYDPAYPPTYQQNVPASLVATASQSFTSSTSWVIVHNLGYVATPTLLSSTNAEITSLATFSSISVNGYTATFGSAQSGTAISTP